MASPSHKWGIKSGYSSLHHAERVVQKECWCKVLFEFSNCEETPLKEEKREILGVISVVVIAPFPICDTYFLYRITCCLSYLFGGYVTPSVWETPGWVRILVYKVHFSAVNHHFRLCGPLGLWKAVPVRHLPCNFWKRIRLGEGYMLLHNRKAS